MISALDTNVLLDILIPGSQYADLSKTLLDDAYKTGSLIINEIVYAELSAQFRSKETLDRFLTETSIRLVSSGKDSLYEAGLAWRAYFGKRRRTRAICSNCGGQLHWKCPHCGVKIPKRQHILSDFLIGGHAVTQADRLLTRDRGYYRAYFKKLKIVFPTEQ